MITKLILTALLIIFYSSINAQTWTQLTNCPKKLDHSVGFLIGNKFYTGTGYDSIYNGNMIDDFYEYDISSNTWSSIATFPGGARVQSISFVIGNKGYVGLGNNNTTCFNDLWEYDPANNLWTQKSNCPLLSCFYSTSAAFSLNNKGYVMSSAGNFGFTNVFEYNSATDTWLQKNNFPGNRRCEASAISVNSKGYFGMGAMWNGGNRYPQDDIWEYNDSTDNWILKTNHPNGSNFWVTSLVHNNDIYFGGGALPSTNLIMKYNPQTNFWTNVPSFPSNRHASIGFSYDCNIFICSGHTNNGNLNKLYKLKVDSICKETGIYEIGAENSITIFPNPFFSEATLKTKDNFQNATLTIFSVMGTQVKKIEKISGQIVNLSRDNLASGVYYFQLTQDNKLITTDKLIITD